MTSLLSRACTLNNCYSDIVPQCITKNKNNGKSKNLHSTGRAASRRLLMLLITITKIYIWPIISQLK